MSADASSNGEENCQGMPMPPAGSSEFYQPEKLKTLWQLVQKGKATSLGTGISAAVWKSDQPAEIWGVADQGTNALAMALNSYECETWADGKPYVRRHWKNGNLQLLPSGVVPRAAFFAPMHMLHIYIPQEAIATIAEVDASSIEMIDPLGERDDDITFCCRQIAREISTNQPMSQIHFDALVTSIAIQLLRRWSNRGEKGKLEQGGLSPHKLRRVVEYLSAHLTEDIGLEDAASVAGLSAKHFARAFKQSTGLPPHRWVIERRVERSQSLLTEGGLTLAEIALECGFADQSHFTATFRRIIGTTPGRWQLDTIS